MEQKAEQSQTARNASEDEELELLEKIDLDAQISKQRNLFFF